MSDFPGQVSPQWTVEKIIYLFIHSLNKIFIDFPFNTRHLSVVKHIEIVKLQEETRNVNFY